MNGSGAFVTDATKELNDIVIIDVMQLDAVNELELWVINST